jgi:hypothetical protein
MFEWQETIDRLARQEVAQTGAAPVVHLERESLSQSTRGDWIPYCSAQPPYASVSMPDAWHRVEVERRCPACVQALAGRADQRRGRA